MDSIFDIKGEPKDSFNSDNWEDDDNLETVDQDNNRKRSSNGL